MPQRKHPQIHRADIFYADLDSVKGSEQGGLRPVLVLQRCGLSAAPLK